MFQPAKPRAACCRGLTLIELLIAVAITAMIAAALAFVARATQTSSQCSEGQSAVSQHARVCIERIARAVNEASASEQFPGFAVFSTTEGGATFPDMLVVWNPVAAPVDPTGRPLFSEIIVYCPDSATANCLLEITVPSDSRQTPALSDVTAWRTELAALKSANSSRKLTITDQLRTGRTGGSSPTVRGAVRFVADSRPTAAQWAGYRAGTVAWSDVDWVQDIAGSQTGLAQNRLAIELQLVPEGVLAATIADQTVPFFGSAAVYYELKQ